jgi:hypothetical protein
MVNIAFMQFKKKYFLPEQNYRPNSQILDVSRPECPGSMGEQGKFMLACHRSSKFFFLQLKLLGVGVFRLELITFPTDFLS